eukprot:scaffold50438_cov57-Phaeocystis_antarctica.AAC.1
MQMHLLDEEHEPELPPPKTLSSPPVPLLYSKKQPGGQNESVRDVWSVANLSDRSSAVAAASHSRLLEMRASPQEPLSIM